MLGAESRVEYKTDTVLPLRSSEVGREGGQTTSQVQWLEISTILGQVQGVMV